MDFDFELWVDRGGTFTDCILHDRRGGPIRALKLLSSDEAPVLALRALLGLTHDAPCPAVDVRIGTTLGTNALLERRGARVLLVTDRGLADLAHIRDQARPDLFARRVVRPVALPAEVLEVGCRIGPDGVVHGRLDAAETRAALTAARERGIGVVAIALRFAPLAPALELALGELALAAGFEHVVLSHRVVPEPGLLARLETTIVDAYLTPVLTAYFASLARALPGSRIRAMRSDGTLTSADRFRGRDAALSGPAGGLVAAASLVRGLGAPAALAFDMGGTSTDVSRVEAQPLPSPEGEVAGLRIRAPMLSVHTIAAGGGSICRVEVGRLVVGPESAGALPGPLCYGHPDAEHLALTDVALVLGRIEPSHFPFPLDAARSFAGLEREAHGLPESSPLRDPVTLAQAFFDVAVSAMARALEDVSIARGHDPRDHPLIVFGGAGGQYACAIARRLGIRTLHFHPLAGVFSAYGIGIAPLGASRAEALVRRELDDTTVEAARVIAAQSAALITAELVELGAASADVRVDHRLVLRYERTETTLELPLSGSADAVRAAFDTEHRRIFGIVRPNARIEALALRSAGRAERAMPRFESDVARRPETFLPLHLDGRIVMARCVSSAALAHGDRVEGPAIVLEAGGTLVVEPGFEARATSEHGITLVDRGMPDTGRAGVARDPVRLEVMGHLVASIANQMGHVLRQTATSPNIRDRLDFSCAVFDAWGGLVANAPHIPVHLGAMGDSVRAVLAEHGADLRPGDVFVTNDPAHGGSHLPDITVVAPVFDRTGILRMFVANRGHHADVGGRVPGSMPAFSSTLVEEGIVLRGLRVMRDGVFEESRFREALAEGPLPARRPDDNVRDLEAQIASVRAGEAQIHAAFDRSGADVVEAYVGHLQASAEERVRAALRALPWRGIRRFEDALDDGTRIVVTLELHEDGTLFVDFEGSSGVHPGNANAPRAVVKSAVLYVLRMLVGRPMPLNEGCLRAVELRIPAPSVLAPPPDAAVSSGNVETSQRVVDVLLGALGLAAASQGTMNNVTFGNERFAYYETLGGGSGATADGPGANAVHSHMTNSRLTDVEVIESCFPVTLLETSIRRGSGGAGVHPGGDGLVREYLLRDEVVASVVSERRRIGPPGAGGGDAGRPGVNSVDGVLREGRFEARLVAGTRLRIETPGAGGYGPVSRLKPPS